MIDPPRPEAIQAVADAKRAGIRTIMITGDHKVTASAIAKEVRQRNIRISIIGIPKTIDTTSISCRSPWFDTAVDKATEAIGCAHVEAVGTPNGIGIVKLMGRESGFIAAQSALALREAELRAHPRSAVPVARRRRVAPRAGTAPQTARARRHHRG